MTPDPKQMFPHIYHPIFAESGVDCSVDFNIEENFLLTTVTCMTIPESNPLEHALAHLKQTQLLKVNGNTVQILEKIVVRTVYPILLEARIAFAKIEALCLDFQRKLEALCLTCKLDTG
jgi:hypothetical protein